MPELPGRSCVVCGETYTAKRSNRQFCSRQCYTRDRSRRLGRVDRRIVIRDGQKQCTRCKEWKPLDRYGRRKDRADKPLSECKTCAAERCKKYNRGEQGRTMRYANKYGVTLEWYEKTLADQGGICAICGNPPDSGNPQHPRLAIDHDHHTGKPRGLLCFLCNSALGRFEDDPALLLRAHAYLTAH